MGVLAGHVEEDVNAVNAPGLAEERGIEVAETKRTTARDFTDLVRVTIVSGETRRASSARRSGAATVRTCWRHGASASTSSWRGASCCSATATCQA